MTLKILVKDSINKVLIARLPFQKTHTSENQLFSELDSLQLRFEQMGFFNNRLDTIIKNDTIYTARFFLGKSTKHTRIYYENDGIIKDLLSQVSNKVTNTYVEVPVYKIPEILNYLVSKYEEKGFTFTTIHLENLHLFEEALITHLKINASYQRKVDKVLINGVEHFPNSFIRHYFKINSNSVFSKKKLAVISTQIRALPFIRETKPPEVLFTNDSTYVYLYLEKIKANTFDGLIGFTSGDKDRSLKLNGYLDLDLYNSFNGGEKISVHWKNNGSDRQTFNFKTELPYIFNTNLSPVFDLNIYKQDSSFINTKINVALGYSIAYNQKLSLALKTESSNNLSETQSETIEDYSTIFYGAQYNYSIYGNSTIFPIIFNFNAGVFFGNRKSNNSTTNQSILNLESSYLWNLNQKNNLFLQNSSAVLTSDNYLINELYRIGGNNSIRGFNEESIFATFYSIFNIEYRYNPTLSSYFYTISDIAYFENQIENQHQKLYSIGLGYAFSTNFGLLNLSYAIGKVDDLPFVLDNSRVHLNFKTFF